MIDPPEFDSDQARHHVVQRSPRNYDEHPATMLLVSGGWLTLVSASGMRRYMPGDWLRVLEQVAP
jgi:hypothetical protein